MHARKQDAKYVHCAPGTAVPGCAIVRVCACVFVCVCKPMKHHTHIIIIVLVIITVLISLALVHILGEPTSKANTYIHTHTRSTAASSRGDHQHTCEWCAFVCSTAYACTSTCVTCSPSTLTSQRPCQGSRSQEHQSSHQCTYTHTHTRARTDPHLTNTCTQLHANCLVGCQ